MRIYSASPSALIRSACAFASDTELCIRDSGESVSEKLSSTGDALKQMLVGPLFRMGKNGTRFETKRLTDILASMIPIIFTGLSVCIMFSANPVSYTHLDVYKRQSQGWARSATKARAIRTTIF